MTTVESRFREIENQLDESLRADSRSFANSGIEFIDWSQRTYHYKNQSLCWSFAFECRQDRGTETEKAAITVSIDELDLEVAKLRRCAEIFQLGKDSRWRHVDEYSLTIKETVKCGLFAIIAPQIEELKRLLASVPH